MNIISIKLAALIFLFSLPVQLYSADDEFIEVVTFSELANYWVINERGKPRMRDAMRSDGGCVAVAMVINSDGTTSDHKVVGSIPDLALDEVAVSAWQRTTYVSVKSNPNKIPVYTTVTLTMFGTRGRVSDEDKELVVKIRNMCEQKADEYLAALIQKVAD